LRKIRKNTLNKKTQISAERKNAKERRKIKDTD